MRANLAAIQILKAIEAEGRPATQAERDALVKYSGWGALSQAFDDDKFDRIARGEIEGLTPDEYQRAQRSTINAHYTSPEIISGLWDMAQRLGFRGGNILEPAAGIGHFIGLMPEGIADRSRVHAVELDSISGRIARTLYHEADVQITGFQSADIADNSIDLAISNVPFANVPVTDPALSAMGGPVDNLHDYFFGKTLTKLRPGGLAIFITSAFTMDKGNGDNRRWLAERADLVAAYRFPNDAFKANAGTEVVTDVIIHSPNSRIRRSRCTPDEGSIVVVIGRVRLFSSR